MNAKRMRVRDREKVWRAAHTALDAGFSDVAMERERNAWERYAEACAEAGVCLSPGCWSSVVAGSVRCTRCHAVMAGRVRDVLMGPVA